MTSTYFNHVGAFIFDNLVPAYHPTESFPGRRLPSNLTWLWLMTRLEVILFFKMVLFQIANSVTAAYVLVK